MDLKFTERDVELIRERLFCNSRVMNKEVNATGILTLLQELWRAARPGQQFPEMSLSTVPRWLRRWGWSWRRAHKKRRPDVDPRAAIQFVWRVLYLMAHDVDLSDSVNADETAFLLYPHRFYTRAHGLFRSTSQVTRSNATR
jgi:hypothetical protein